MKKLIEIIFENLSNKDLIPDNKTYQIIETIANSTEQWLVEEFAYELQNWLIEEYTPATLEFQYWAHTEFPKTFKSKFINKDNKNIEEAEYEEIYSDI